MREPTPTKEPMIFYGGGDGVPPACLCLVFLAAGVLVFCIGLNPDLWRPSEIGPFGQGEMFFGFALMAIGGWLLKVRNDILRLLPTEALCARMELPEATLKRIAQEHGIRPRYIVNGQDYYAPDDFDVEAAKTLLRAASPFDHQKTLLRSSMDDLQSPQRLLRASDTGQN
jgi:hypothetical protein